MYKGILKLSVLFTVIDILLFCGLIATSMTDDKPHAAGKVFYWLLKHVFGFPLNLINSNFPFFLDSSSRLPATICFGILNNLILAFMIVWIARIFSSKSTN